MAPPSATLEEPVQPIPFRPQDEEPGNKRAGLLSSILSLLVIGAVIYAIRGVDPKKLLEMVPTSPFFWLVFAASYLAGPASEWVIFRRLWQLPPGGFAALLRKLVYNELILGYLGEVFFYKWARKHMQTDAAPFGAVKDVAILSAIAGNVVTVALLALIWPLMGTTQLGMESRPIIWSLAVVLLTSLAAMFFRKRLFSLPRNELRFVLAMHFGRIAVTTLLSALMWHLVLPDVPILWWVLLATIRLLISRLPFVPNKDVVFAGLAVFTLGHEVEIASLLTMLAGLILVTHLLVGTSFALHDLVKKEELA